MSAVPREAAPAADADLLPTLCCLFAAAVLLGAGYGIWDNIAADLHLVALFSSLLCYVAAFALIVIGFTRSRHATVAVVGGVALAFTVYASSYVLFKSPYYDSDAMLFNSYSAQLLLQGSDPYTKSMQPGYRAFGVPEGETTPTLNGGEVYALSYPALSFLIYVPFLALGVSNVLWVSVAAHLLIMLMLVWMAPARFKALAPFVLFLDATYFDYTVGGITDVLWLPAGMLTARYWRRNPVAAGAWLGVASAFKQTPWVIVPFALVFWLRAALAARRPKLLLAPGLALAAAFALPNLPFVIWHPHAWLAGTMTPLSAHLIVLGTGIAQLATSGLLTLSPATFTGMTAVAFAAALLLYVLFPKRLAFLPFFAPAFVYFFASRSLHNYFMYWPLILMAYLFANGREYFSEARSERLRVSRTRSAAVLTLAALAALPLVAHSSPRALSVSINGESRNAITGRIAKLRVSVRNNSNRPRYLHFDVAQQGDDLDVQAWEPRKLQRVPPGSTQTFVLSAPSPQFELATDGNTATQLFLVDSAGQEFYSSPIVFGAPAPTIHNADLAYWSLGAHPFPVAWNFDAADWEQGRLFRYAVGGRTAVALRATGDRRPGWRTTLLEQITDARPARLRFMLYPVENYDGAADPHALFGVVLRDVVGNAAYYTIDARRRSPATYRTADGTITVLPGRLHAWNAVDVDIARLRTESGFVLSPSATMAVGALGTADEGGRPASDYFGGLTVLEGNTQLDRMLRAEGVAALPASAGGGRLAAFKAARSAYVDDDGDPDSPTGFAYAGDWQHVRARFDGRSRGTSTRSHVPGAVAELRFAGSGVRLYGVRGGNGGRASLTLDGRTHASADFYAASKQVGALVFKAAGLERGEHRLLIVVQPDAADAKRRFVNIDGAEVTR